MTTLTKWMQALRGLMGDKGSSLSDSDPYSALVDFRNENVARNPVERIAPSNVEIQTDERTLTGHVIRVPGTSTRDADEDDFLAPAISVISPPPSPPAISLSANPTTVGPSATVWSAGVGISIQRINGFSGLVTLTVSGLPSNARVRMNDLDQSTFTTNSNLVTLTFFGDATASGTYTVTVTGTASGVSAATTTVGVTFYPLGGGGLGGGGGPSSSGLALNVNLNASNSLNWGSQGPTRLNGVIMSVSSASGAYPGPFQILMKGAGLYLGTAGPNNPPVSATANPIKAGEVRTGYLDFGVGSGTGDITVTFEAVVVGTFVSFTPPLKRDFLFHMH